MLGTRVLKDSLKLTVLISQCIGQLPILRDERLDWWRMAQPSHPLFIFFVFLLIFRVLVYSTFSYIFIRSQLSFTETSSYATEIIGEMIYFWLRFVLAPYLLLSKLPHLSDALRKVQEVDSILGTENLGYANKPRRVTIVLFGMTVLIVPVLMFVQREYYKWFGKYMPCAICVRMMIAWTSIDLLMETVILVQFCVASILLQQRLANLRSHVKKIKEPVVFLSKVAKTLEYFSGNDIFIPITELERAYCLMCQIATAISQCFQWPVFCFTLGKLLVLTLHTFDLVMYKRVEGSAEGAPGIVQSAVILVSYSMVSLHFLFHFADETQDQVPELQLELQALVASKNFNDSEMQQNARLFHQMVSSNPFPKISAAGFFNVGKSLIPGVLGIVVTYAVVLIQFDLPSTMNPCKCHNITLLNATG